MNIISSSSQNYYNEIFINFHHDMTTSNNIYYANIYRYFKTKQFCNNQREFGVKVLYNNNNINNTLEVIFIEYNNC